MPQATPTTTWRHRARKPRPGREPPVPFLVGKVLLAVESGGEGPGGVRRGHVSGRPAPPGGRRARPGERRARAERYPRPEPGDRRCWIDGPIRARPGRGEPGRRRHRDGPGGGRRRGRSRRRRDPTARSRRPGRRRTPRSVSTRTGTVPRPTPTSTWSIRTGGAPVATTCGLTGVKVGASGAAAHRRVLISSRPGAAGSVSSPSSRRISSESGSALKSPSTTGGSSVRSAAATCAARARTCSQRKPRGRRRGQVHGHHPARTRRGRHHDIEQHPARTLPRRRRQRRHMSLRPAARGRAPRCRCRRPRRPASTRSTTTGPATGAAPRSCRAPWPVRRRGCPRGATTPPATPRRPRRARAARPRSPVAAAPAHRSATRGSTSPRAAA